MGDYLKSFSDYFNDETFVTLRHQHALTMTIPPKTVTVKCPQCQQIYIDWYVAAVRAQSANAQAPSTVCSQCGHRSVLSELSEHNGVYQQIQKL